MAKNYIKTSKKQIVEWAQSNLNECFLGVDASEMSTHCWRCGHNDRPLERCHVIPASLKGEDIPSNYRLLCNDCHHEAPNVNDPNEMDDWIKRTCVPTYNTFWEIRKTVKKVASETIDGTIRHFGHKGLNDSTRKWVEKKASTHPLMTKLTGKLGPFYNDYLHKPFEK
jgi:hypothetical protein